MKKLKELQIQFSQNIETSNQVFIVQGRGKFHQLPKVSALFVSLDRGTNLEWWKIFVERR